MSTRDKTRQSEHKRGNGRSTPPKVYLDLMMHLRKKGDLRTADEVVVQAVRRWMAAQHGDDGTHGYQWGELFLADGTQLRVRYRGAWHHARIERDHIWYEGETLPSPREWLLFLTGTVRNPWRDIWLRRSVHESWTRALQWRTSHARSTRTGGPERRHLHRRSTD